MGSWQSPTSASRHLLLPPRCRCNRWALHAVQATTSVPLPLPRTFPSFREDLAIVNRDGHIEVDDATTPRGIPGPASVGAALGRTVGATLFNDRVDRSPRHAQNSPGRFSTLAPHIADEKISVERSGAPIGSSACAAWASGSTWAEAGMERASKASAFANVGLTSTLNASVAAARRPIQQLSAARRAGVAGGDPSRATILCYSMSVTMQSVRWRRITNVSFTTPIYREAPIEQRARVRALNGNSRGSASQSLKCSLHEASAPNPAQLRTRIPPSWCRR